MPTSVTPLQLLRLSLVVAWCGVWFAPQKLPLTHYLKNKFARFAEAFTIWLTRHGQSQFNVEHRIGGNSALASRGRVYAEQLPRELAERGATAEDALVITSTLERTIQTARGLPHEKRALPAFDEIRSGARDGMTEKEIEERFPEEAAARKADKLRYRYPGGESYLDLERRVLAALRELLSQKRNQVVLVAHQAVLRVVYAFLRPDKCSREEDVPRIEVPLHTIIKLTFTPKGSEIAGVEERFPVDVDAVAPAAAAAEAEAQVAEAFVAAEAKPEVAGAFAAAVVAFFAYALVTSAQAAEPQVAAADAPAEAAKPQAAAADTPAQAAEPQAAAADAPAEAAKPQAAAADTPAEAAKPQAAAADAPAEAAKPQAAAADTPAEAAKPQAAAADAPAEAEAANAGPPLSPAEVTAEAVAEAVAPAAVAHRGLVRCGAEAAAGAQEPPGAATVLVSA